jgi:hypothetical protein
MPISVRPRHRFHQSTWTFPRCPRRCPRRSTTVVDLLSDPDPGRHSTAPGHDLPRHHPARRRDRGRQPLSQAVTAQTTRAQSSRAQGGAAAAHRRDRGPVPAGCADGLRKPERPEHQERRNSTCDSCAPSCLVPLGMINGSAAPGHRRTRCCPERGQAGCTRCEPTRSGYSTQFPSCRDTGSRASVRCGGVSQRTDLLARHPDVARPAWRASAVTRTACSRGSNASCALGESARRSPPASTRCSTSASRRCGPRSNTAERHGGRRLRQGRRSAVVGTQRVRLPLDPPGRRPVVLTPVTGGGAESHRRLGAT